MKIFLQAGVAGQDLICMNRCHMYLQAIFLLDICNGTGTAIVWDGQAQCNSQYQWPKTEKPMTMEWQEWRCTITQALSVGCNGQLVVPLGKWALETRQADGYFLKPDNNHLLKHKENHWYRHTRAPGQPRALKYQHNPRAVESPKMYQQTSFTKKSY